MASLVDTVLDEARLEAGHVKPNERPFDVRALVDDLAAIMAPLAAEKGLSFAICLSDGVPDFSSADDVRLRKAGFRAPIVALTASDVRKLDS